MRKDAATTTTDLKVLFALFMACPSQASAYNICALWRSCAWLAVTGQADLRATVRSHGVYRKLPVLSHLPERPPQFSLSVPMTLVRRFRRSISQSFSSTGQVLGLWLHLAQLPRSLERESLPLSFWLLRS